MEYKRRKKEQNEINESGYHEEKASTYTHTLVVPRRSVLSTPFPSIINTPW